MKKIYLLFAFGLFITAGAQAQIISTIAGNGTGSFSGDGGQATAAELDHPYGVFEDASGNIFIADQWNHRIRKITSAGVISTIAGTGSAGFSGDGGQATAAHLNYPSQIYVDATGNVFIADEFNSCVRKINTSGVISTFAGMGGVASYSGDGGQATAAELNYCTDMTFDAVGNMYIADYTGQRIRKVNTSGVISTIAGTGTTGYSGDNGPATAADLNYPYGVAINAAGDIFFSDRYNNRIRKIDAAGTITTIAGTGAATYTGDNGPATAATVNNCYKVNLDATGNIYIADFGNSAIRKIDLSGTITTIAGTIVGGYSGDGGPATNAELAQPGGVFVNSGGDVFIGDANNYRVRMIASTESVNEVNAGTDNNVNLYPVPSCGQLVVTLKGNGYSNLKLYDVFGREVYSQALDASEQNKSLNLNISNLSNGVYFMRIYTQKDMISKRVLLQK
ncbi:MAG TPA: T9SS type A sorting domain-containing protein [Bacteroidia bacterium]|nr:T9SS type A sorting domain-containing protein [Bacteroidia bacterium]